MANNNYPVQFHNPNRPGQHPPTNNFPQAPGAGYGGPAHQGISNGNVQMNWQPSPAAAPSQQGYGFSTNPNPAGRIPSPVAMNNPSYQQPAQFPSLQTSSKQQFYQPPSTPQQQQPQPAIFNAFSGNNVVANMAMNQASSYLSEHSKQYIPGAYGVWGSLKYYFTVNNSFVMKKFQILLFPFRHPDWQRIRTSGNSNESSHHEYAPPSRDLNAPDLYIPLMSFVTYLLVAGFVKGATGEFSPDVIGQVGSYGLVMQSIEIGLLKLALYLFKIDGATSLLDLAAFTGYKYVSLVVNMVLGIVFGDMAYYISLIYTGIAISYCTIYSLKGSLPESNYGDQKPKTYLLYGVGIFQFILIWWNAYK